MRGANTQVAPVLLLSLGPPTRAVPPPQVTGVAALLQAADLLGPGATISINDVGTGNSITVASY